MHAIMIGLDIAKSVFQAHGEDWTGRIIIQKRLRRAQVVPFFATLLPARTYNEAQRMAMLGARALHPRTIEPVARWGIPLELRATETPHAPGTDIMPDSAQAWGHARDGAWIVAARPLATDARLAPRRSQSHRRWPPARCCCHGWRCW